jgi:chloride channel protein, CIC family
VIILFELTGEYTIILPLMLAIVAATAVSHALSKETIYTLKLARRGVDLDARTGGHGRMGQVTVAAVMELLPDPLAADTSITAAGRALWLSANGVLPVMGADERYHGCVTARALAEALANTESADRTWLIWLRCHRRSPRSPHCPTRYTRWQELRAPDCPCWTATAPG